MNRYTERIKINKIKDGKSGKGKTHLTGIFAALPAASAQLSLRNVSVRIAGNALLVGPHRHCNLHQDRGDGAAEINGAPPWWKKRGLDRKV